MNIINEFVRSDARHDQNLMQFKEYFESRTPEQRQRFTELVTGISKLMGGISGHEAYLEWFHSLGCESDAIIGVTISISKYDPDKPTAEVNPHMLAEAVTCWNCGEEYLPNSWIA